MRILIVGGVARRDPVFLTGLAGQCEVVIAADAGGASCLEAGLVPDLVVGDLDSLDPDDVERLRAAGAPFVIAPTAKDVTDLDLAFDEARRREANEIWATGVLGDRFDHSMASIGTISRHATSCPRVFEPELSAWILAPGGRPRIQVRGRGAILSLFALNGPAVVSSSGLLYPLDRDALPPLDSRGLSNVVDNDTATVEVFDGCVLALSVLTNGSQLAHEGASEPHDE